MYADGHGNMVTDACYLELALRRGAKLATLDRKLARAAEAVGASLLFTRKVAA
jgi:predicted nucleic acid-binding protein